MGNSSSSESGGTLVVLSSVDLEGGGDGKNLKEGGIGGVSERDARNDGLDDFNHPRIRRARILEALRSRSQQQRRSASLICYRRTEPCSDLMELYGPSDDDQSDGGGVHSRRLLEFLQRGWQQWVLLGPEGRDPSGYADGYRDDDEEAEATVPPLTFTNVPLPRFAGQRPSKHVLGKMGYFCTDKCTPIFADLRKELLEDAGTVRAARNLVLRRFHRQLLGKLTTPEEGHETEDDTLASVSEQPLTAYALPTHPGHHAAYDSFGGYCYTNHAAALAKSLLTSQRQQPENEQRLPDSTRMSKVAVLDVDYHCGNGTASIFHSDPNVLVVSIHCDPDCEYPFHAGYADDTGSSPGKGTTLHLPLQPGTTWKGGYEKALQRGLAKIREFGADAVVVSLGLDTHEGDPVSIKTNNFSISKTFTVCFHFSHSLVSSVLAR